MSRTIEGDPTTPDYWNKRVKAIPGLKDVLFLDARREEFWKRVREQLSQWSMNSVLDVACGWGQFADCFAPNKYTGVDFSEEMFKLAGIHNPDRGLFKCADIKTLALEEKYDVIFEVNSLLSLGMTAEQFIEKFKPHATKAVACLEADQFIIHQIYEYR